MQWIQPLRAGTGREVIVVMVLSSFVAYMCYVLAHVALVTSIGYAM